MKTIISIIIASSLLVSCKSKKDAKAKEETKTENTTVANTNNNENTTNSSDQGRRAGLVVSIEKTPCFGKCKVYKAEIFSNGAVTFYGEQNVKNIGKYYGTISYDQVKEIWKKADEINYMKLKSEYDDKMVTDLPTTITTLRPENENKAKTIRVRYRAPEELYEFQQYIHQLVMDVQYTKAPEGDE